MDIGTIKIIATVICVVFTTIDIIAIFYMRHDAKETQKSSSEYFNQPKSK